MAFQATVQTMAVFFLVLAIGFVAGKMNVIKEEFMPGLSALITKVFLPAMIFYNTASTVTCDLVVSNLWLLPASLATYAALAAVAFAVAKAMRLPHDRDRVFQFAFVFGNTGFVGFPLLPAVFPGTGMLFMCMFSIVDLVAFWTYGVWLATARERDSGKPDFRKMLSPNVIAIVLAFAFCLSGLGLPPVIDSALGTIGRSTSALCMVYLGAMICFSSIGATLRRPDAYVAIIVKMVLLPIAAGLTARSIGLPADIAGCLALFVALPVMTVVPMVARENGDEGDYAASIAVASFIACMLTMPLVAFAVL